MPLLSLLAIIVLVFNSVLKAGERDIVVVESYHTMYPWDRDWLMALRDSLAHYNLITFQMDTKRLPRKQFTQRAEIAWDIIKSVDPALVILGDDNALSYLATKVGNSQYKVIYLGINSNPRKTAILKYKNITGVLERPLYRRSIIEMKKVLPGMKKVLIMFDGSTTSKYASEDLFQGNDLVTYSGVEMHLETTNNYERWKSVLLSAKENGYDAIWVGLYFTVFDKQEHIDHRQLLSWTSNNSKVPLFALWDFAVGKQKTIGGYVMTGNSQGAAAGLLAQQVLAGTLPKDILPVIAEHGEMIFSRHELDRWQLILPMELQLSAEFVE
ncbi:ABC transporter substrate-binding protein [Zooshikella ganghwensis]|uniref:ABC transporter substrate-binding protein n=1 Tax=Zooshikella ganghwensis TaxID=202772 RepID=UPI000417910B|nr:ABC transporter substrate binding protein [Zooshikella ganghwensis]